MKPIVISTFGSLGDVHPYIALAKALKQLGLEVVIATNPDYKSKIEQHGIAFKQVGEAFIPLFESGEIQMSSLMDRINGPEYVLRKVVLPRVRAYYEELSAVVDEVELFVTHPLSFAAMLVARKRNIPFVSTVLAPLSMWSRYDPPAMPLAPWVPLFGRYCGPGITGLLMDLMKSQTYGWFEPYRQLQAQLGIEVDRRNPIFEGQFSPVLNLALFSPVFGPLQPDWPTNTIATGFPFLDTEIIDETIRKKVRAFLQEGTEPVVFTLGSSAIWDPGQFWKNSISALENTDMRGVLLVGPSRENNCPEDLPPHVMAVDYLPHELIFRHSSMIVHQGGVGTTAQALRSGRPQLIMPFSHDQFDNAERIRRLGCGLVCSRSAYSPQTARRLLCELRSAQMVSNATRIGDIVRAEHGSQTAAEAIAEVIRTGKATSE
jgi:rhamnosyltransferase subunit B